MVVGLASTVGAFLIQSASVPQLAIGLGGVLLAEQSLTAIVSQIQLLSQLAKSWKQIAPLFQAARRPTEKSLAALFDTENSQSTVPKPSSGEVSQSARPQPPGGNGKSANHDPLLAMRDVSFRYREHGRLALNDINLQVYRGDRLLLEGPSGGGKSTLAATLSGWRIPEAGLLLLRGYDRASVGMEAWRKHVVVAPQFHENHVFSETLLFNLLMGRRWPPLPEDEQEAVEICNELGLGELIARMPSGLLQMVGENGWQLSHGERSRLYIARALLQGSDLIVLDESFAALDPESLSRSLQCVLERAPTLIVIAHP
jgi:ATP-binding cassette subfamily B protein